MPDTQAQAFEELYGPLYRFSDHKRGDTIIFTESELGERAGVIVWVCAPGLAADGTMLPIRYIVESGTDENGIPDEVWISDVIQVL